MIKLLREKSSTIQSLIKDEIHCTPLWSQLNVEIAAGIVEETASVITDAITGTIPSSQGNTYALVMKKPLGVVLGIAPWNAPVILGLRSVIPVVAAGNTAILKVSVVTISKSTGGGKFLLTRVGI